MGRLDHSSLVALRRRFILAGLLFLLGAGFNVGCIPKQMGGCSDNQTFPIMRTDAGSRDGSIDDLLARCQASSSDCTQLCEAFLPKDDGVSVESCELVRVDGGLAVRAVWTSYCG